MRIELESKVGHDGISQGAENRMNAAEQQLGEEFLRMQVDRTRRMELEANRHEYERMINQLKQKVEALYVKIRILQEAAKSHKIQKENQKFFRSRFQNEFNVVLILGIGSSGCVFQALHKIDGYKYAVRRIPIDKSEKKEIKALREIRVMTELDHDGIIRLNSSWIEHPPEGWQQRADMELYASTSGNNGGEFTREIMHYNADSSFIYIQMQNWKESLASWLPRNPMRELSLVKSWFKQIASAVAYIHDKRFIHRDLKPRNIVIMDNSLLKICDFGIITNQRVEDGVEKEEEHDRCGTIMYMSPEQGSILPMLTSKSDVFTLGLILTEMILVMADDERIEIFDNYRQGRPNDRIEDSETAEFVAWLTRINPKSRPSCNEIMRHSFLFDVRDQ